MRLPRILLAALLALLVLNACQEDVTPTPIAVGTPTATVVAQLPASATPALLPATETAVPDLATATNPPTPTTTVAPTGTPTPIPPSPSPSPTPSISGDPTLTGTLTLWHSWSGREAAALAKSVALFNSFYPNVQVTTEAIRVDQLDVRFSAEAGQDKGPDLLLGSIDSLGSYADAGLVLPLDDAIGDLRGKLLPASVAAVTYGGKLFAAPATFNTVALFYNTKLAASVPHTIDELLKNAAGDGGLALPAGFYGNAGWVGAFGGTLFDDTGCSTIGAAAGTSYLGFLQQLATAPGVTADAGDQALGPDFAAGKYGLIANGSWAIGDYRAALGKSLAAAPLPSGPGGPATPFLEAVPLMINAHHPAEQHTLAATFVRFYLSIENQTLMMREADHLPANTTVDTSADPTISGFMRQAQSAIPVPLSAEMDNSWDALETATQSVIMAHTAPADAAQEAATTINSLNGKKCK